MGSKDCRSQCRGAGEGAVGEEGCLHSRVRAALLAGGALPPGHARGVGDGILGEPAVIQSISVDPHTWGNLVA